MKMHDINILHSSSIPTSEAFFQLNSFSSIKKKMQSSPYTCFLSSKKGTSNFTLESNMSFDSTVNVTPYYDVANYADDKSISSKKHPELDMSTVPKHKTVYGLNMITKYLLQHGVFAIINGSLYYFNGIIWELANKTNFVMYCKSIFADDLRSYLSTQNYIEIYNQLSTEPTLINDSESCLSSSLICFRNGVLDTKTGELLEHSAKYLFFTYINHDYCETMSNTPYFDSYIKSICHGNSNLYDRILEVLGYIISDYSFCKVIPVLYGPRNSGKSTFAKLLELIVGQENCSSFNINEIDKWTSAVFFKKKVCFNTDMANEVLNKKAIALLKQLSGGDKIKAERKNENPFSYYNTAKIVLASNYQITLPDQDKALVNRFLPLPFLHSIPEEEIIPNLLDNLANEIPHIIASCVNALKRLIDNNFVFTPLDPEIEALLEANKTEYIEDSSDTILLQFINDECIVSNESRCCASDLYMHYRNYYLSIYQAGTPLSQIVFSKKLRKHVEIQNGPHNQSRTYIGITLKQDMLDDMEE